MKVAFTPGTLVRFTCPDGAIGKIGDVRKTSDWGVPGYLGDGFYEVIVEGRPMVAHEDDIELYTPGKQSEE